jgi:hypothetical protein
MTKDEINDSDEGQGLSMHLTTTDPLANEDRDKWPFTNNPIDYRLMQPILISQHQYELSNSPELIAAVEAIKGNPEGKPE